MPSEKTYYEILSVSRNADLNTIKVAYRNKVRDTHPDRFEAKLAHLRRTGNSAQIYALERKLENAQQATQQLNEAYAVLSDAARRRQYDLSLAEVTNAQIAHERYARHENNWEQGRRSVKQRSHHDPNNPHSPPRPNDNSLPWVIMVAFLVVMVILFGLLTNFLTVIDHQPFTTYVPRQPTAQGVVSANDLQATTSSRRATAVSRTAAAIAPTSTPRSVDNNRASAQALMAVGEYQLALEPLDLAIEQAPDNADLYFMRGLVYHELAETDTIALDAAIADLTNALNIDEGLAAAYRERGMAFYQLFRITGELPLVEQAQADLERFTQLNTETDAEVDEVLENLEAILD